MNARSTPTKILPRTQRRRVNHRTLVQHSMHLLMAALQRKASACLAKAESTNPKLITLTAFALTTRLVKSRRVTMQASSTVIASVNATQALQGHSASSRMKKRATVSETSTIMLKPTLHRATTATTQQLALENGVNSRIPKPAKISESSLMMAHAYGTAMFSAHRLFQNAVLGITTTLLLVRQTTTKKKMPLKLAPTIATRAAQASLQAMLHAECNAMHVLRQQ